MWESVCSCKLASIIFCCPENIHLQTVCFCLVYGVGVIEEQIGSQDHYTMLEDSLHITHLEEILTHLGKVNFWLLQDTSHSIITSLVFSIYMCLNPNDYIIIQARKTS